MKCPSLKISKDKDKRANLKTGVLRKQRAPNFRKTSISYSLIRTRTCAYQGVRDVRFSENLACFVFLKQPFSDSPFCFITDYPSLKFLDFQQF